MVLSYKIYNFIQFYCVILFLLNVPINEMKHVHSTTLWHSILWKDASKIWPLLDDRLKWGTPKALKWPPLSLLVCLLTSYRSQVSTKEHNFVEICSLELWWGIFLFFSFLMFFRDKPWPSLKNFHVTYHSYHCCQLHTWLTQDAFSSWINSCIVVEDIHHKHQF